jgi:hypothetical protein
MGPCFRRDDKWGYHLHFSNSLPCSATTSRSRRVFCASFAGTSRPLRTEGAGNAERPMRPIAACAMVVVERTRVSQVTPESPGIPRAMVYGLYRALPGEPGFLATVASGIASTDLTPASGCQDHTTSPSARQRPRLWHRLRPPHPASNVRDDRETPLERKRDRIAILLICPGRQAKFLKIRN